ncbi:MAG: Crp/Fnr family transcriptional regulator [Timaviella obliquedivisa GSE-PSE-MK23-08B]|jgi:CRP-like cAMP-binding protein|nr:Crp/Fnr family transcriptional regulator [Timaviella obliquedivisa GSE-PSE-MK23-08B]
MPTPQSQLSNPSSNWLLAALSGEVYQRIKPDLEPVTLPIHQVLYDVNEPIPYLYFPHSATVSLVYPMQEGAIIEVGVVGIEGMVGLPALLGGMTQTHRANVQVEGWATRVSTEIIRTEFRRGGELQDLLLRYFQSFLAQVSLTAVSNRLYTIEERLARWLLLVSDSLQSETFALTQEFISQMLGVRRSGVTVAASALSQAQLIQYRRGHITILNRNALEEFAGEVYRSGQAEVLHLLSDRFS